MGWKLVSHTDRALMQLDICIRNISITLANESDASFPFELVTKKIRQEKSVVHAQNSPKKPSDDFSSLRLIYFTYILALCFQFYISSYDNHSRAYPQTTR